MIGYRNARAAVAPLAKTTLLKSGALRVLRTVRPRPQLAILRYHAICDESGHRYASPGICVSPAAFEAQVRYLAEHYRVLPLPEAASALSRRMSLPRNAVVLTFDDGYADNLAAARVLHRHGVNATFYITAGCMDGGEPFWPSELNYLVASIQGSPLVVTSLNERIELPLTSGSERHQAVRRLTRLFKSRSIPERERIRAMLRDVAGNPVLPRVMLTWDEIRQMHAMGMTIGSHTTTHPNLPSAGADAEHEIRGARARLEAEIGAPVTMFSYPNGGAERYYTPELQRIVRDTGYACATTSQNAFAHADSDLYALERVQVSERLEDLIYTLDVESVLASSAGAEA